MLKRGVILGLSGGSDSVMLLYVLLNLRKLYGDFRICAVHVNHMLRGKDADGDEAFCVELCKSLGVDISVHRVNVSHIAEKKGIGFEEAARNVRYGIFFDEAEKLGNNACIAVAHNATDNVETMLFNMMRGSGITGLAGIKPVRDRILRPMITIPKREILLFLEESGIKYVTDKTNFDIEYSRNYIRHEIIPRLEKLTIDPEKMATRVSANLRDDIDFIECEAEKHLSACTLGHGVSISELRKTPKAIFSRIISKIIGQKSEKTPEQVHIDKIYELIFGGDFEYSLPGKKRVVARGDVLSIEDYKADEKQSFFYQLTKGVNEFEDFDNVIIISDSPIEQNYSNVYKIEICTTIPGDIIYNGLYVRNKIDGDAYSYGGITHKLKKLFSDKKIPKEDRDRVPVICDESGILWVPGFGVRGEGETSNNSYIAIASKVQKNNKKIFYICQRNMS